MPKLRTPLTKELIERIVVRIEGGAYPAVAAQAEGVQVRIFGVWMHAPHKLLHGELQRRVATATAHARAVAETALLKVNPAVWLKCGPGRETEAEEGWTGVVRPKPRARGNINALADPEWSKVWSLLSVALAQYPGALVEVQKALSREEASPAES